MNCKPSHIVIGSLLFGLLTLPLCIKAYISLPLLEPGSVVTPRMYSLMLSELKILIFGVLLPQSLWLLIVAFSIWRIGKKSKKDSRDAA